MFGQYERGRLVLFQGCITCDNTYVSVMSYRHLSLSCRCGQAPSRIDEVGLTDDHEIVIHWWCEECKRVVYASKSLSSCWPDFPRDTLVAASRSEIPEETLQSAFDAQFLQQMGIREE